MSDTKSLASELLAEIKATSKRWFIAFIIMCAVEIATISGFIWYISLPVDEENISQEANDFENSTLKQIIGEDE